MTDANASKAAPNAADTEGARQRVAAYLEAFAAYAPTEDLDGEQIHWLGTNDEPRVLTVSDLRALLAALPPGVSP
jgi:hypothetical protein